MSDTPKKYNPASTDTLQVLERMGRPHEEYCVTNAMQDAANLMRDSSQIVMALPLLYQNNEWSKQLDLNSDGVLKGPELQLGLVAAARVHHETHKAFSQITGADIAGEVPEVQRDIDKFNANKAGRNR